MHRRIHYNPGAKTRRCIVHKYEDDTRIVAHWLSPSLGGHFKRYVSERYGFEPCRTYRKRYMHIDPGGMLLVDDPIVTVTIDACGYPFDLSFFDLKADAAINMLQYGEVKRRFNMDDETVRVPSFASVMLVMRPEERDQAIDLIQAYIDEYSCDPPEPETDEIEGEF